MAENPLNKTTTEYLVQMNGAQVLLIESQGSQNEQLTEQIQRIESYARRVSERSTKAVRRRR